MTPNPAGATRRQLLRASALGAAAAAALAACSTQKGPAAGVSGESPPSTSVPPTVPPYTPKEADLANNDMLLRTAASIELFAADVYTTYGKNFSDPAWQATADRFATDHEAAAAVFNDGLDAKDQITEPNPWLVENSLDPVKKLLETDAQLFTYFTGIESTIAATYLTTVGQWVVEDDADRWRKQYAAYAGAAARRVSSMGDDGTGQIPPEALYPTTDLIPNDAYMITEPSASEDKANAEEDQAVGG